MSSLEAERQGDDLTHAKELKINSPSSINELNVASKSNEHSLTHTSKSQQANQSHHNQQQQQLLHQLNRHECGSNQSGSDSGLGHTNSISSENSSLIANTTSLEQINAQNNGKGDDNREIDVSKFVTNKNSRQIPIINGDNFDGDEKAQKSASFTDESGAIACIESGKTDAGIIGLPLTKAARNDDLNGDIKRNDAQHLHSNERQLAKLAKVSESANNNVKTNQDSGLLSSSLPTTRTKDGLASRETLSARESSTNSAKVINNMEDEAKIKHSAKCGINQVANSAIRPREADNRPIDSSAPNHEIQSSNLASSGHGRPVQRINPIVSPTSGTLPLIKSSLKKTGGRSVDAPKRTKPNRNVSFNQTVIVFCEEIETPSPSETFEPPLDYQDSFNEPQSLPSNHDDASVRDTRPQNAYANDDFDILSKIVCDDASSLTDDQLIGLLENGSLLKKFDLDESDKSLTLDRLNSDQSYLCHDAISDSESESSLTTDIRLRDMVAVNDKQQLPGSNRAKAIQLEAKRSASRADPENSMECNNSQFAEAHFESHVGPSSAAQHRSMPARVKVSTVDDNLRRQHKPIADESDTISRGSTCTKLMQASKQDSAKSEPVLVRLTNADPVALSRPQAREKVLEDTSKWRSTLEHGKDCSQGVVIKTGNSPNSLLASNDQINSRESQLDVNQQKTSNSPSQPVNVVNAQIIQTNQACHICRAIESNINQTKLGQRGERTSLASNISLAQQQHFDRASEQPQPSQPQRTANIHPQHQGSNNATIESQQKQAQLVASSQSSCVSCRELSARQRPTGQNYVTQLVRPNLASNPLDHQQAKPIACQLVYVVDQCGNRMRALQVVTPAQVSLQTNQMRPVMIGAHDSCRQPAPSAAQNLYCVFNPTNPTMSMVRNASIPVSATNAQVLHPHCDPMRGAPPQAINQQQQRMQIVNHAAPKNHTVYYVRQPLCSQEHLQKSSNMANPVARTFPDVHEIRRLDGIRAPAESPSLMQTTNNPSPSAQTSGGKEAQPQSGVENRFSRVVRRDDSEDPTFGFSSRPAVKVVANSMRDSQPKALGLVNGLNHTMTLNSNSRSLAGSQTLDRRGINRDRLNQRDVKENIPGTSSMSNINWTLATYVNSTNHIVHEDNSKAKEINVDHLKDRNNFQMQTSHPTDGFVQARHDKKDQNRPDVAYVMNI